MSDHPSSFGGTPRKIGETEWNDRASLHRIDDSDGVLDGMRALRRGTFAELIRHIVLLPEDERGKYMIEKAGDREYSAAEAVALALRDDFPKARLPVIATGDGIAPCGETSTDHGKTWQGSFDLIYRSKQDPSP